MTVISPPHNILHQAASLSPPFRPFPRISPARCGTFLISAQHKAGHQLIDRGNISRWDLRNEQLRINHTSTGCSWSILSRSTAGSAAPFDHNLQGTAPGDRNDDGRNSDSPTKPGFLTPKGKNIESSEAASVYASPKNTWMRIAIKPL